MKKVEFSLLLEQPWGQVFGSSSRHTQVPVPVTIVLIVDGGILQNADITMIPGSTLIVRNNGKINMATGKMLKAPEGVVVNIESGEIN